MDGGVSPVLSKPPTERPYMDDARRAAAALEAFDWNEAQFHRFLVRRGWEIDFRNVRRWFSGVRPFPSDLLAWLLRHGAAMEADPVPDQPRAT